jgi:NAD(P)H-hydrate epimerase
MYAIDNTAILSCNLYSAQQVKEGEVICAQKAGFSMYQLMEKAGHAVFDVFLAHYSQQRRVAIVAGRGNNGGDAYVFARLAMLSNYDVSVYSFKPTAPLTGDAEIARQSLISQGGKIQDLFDADFSNADVIIDGLLGTGFYGDLRSDAKEAIAKINNSNIPVIAIDLPSGLLADTGVAASNCIKAQYTVTFIAPKIGLFVADGPDQTGHLVFSDLGVGHIFETLLHPKARIYGLGNQAQISRRKRNTNKGKNGHVLCIGGNVGMPGAAYLAGKAALRSGVGKVSVLCHPENVSTINMLCPELMVWGYERERDNALVSQKLSSADVVLLGPGLGTDEWAKTLMKLVLSVKNKPLILDADGLNLLSQDDEMNNYFAQYPSHKVITPHPLEAARLLKNQVSDISQNRLEAASQLADKYHSNIVLKGNNSLVVEAGEISVNLTGNSGMASAGMGDVLAGIIAAFIANKENLQINLNERVKLAVYLHGLAGDFAAKSGEIGIIASDIIEQLPLAIKSCSK